MAKPKRTSDKPKGRQRPERERPATNENAKLRRQLADARREQVAAAEILKVISRSSNDLGPVLDTIAETAAQLCNADFAFVYKLYADTFHLAASSNANAEWVQYVRDHPVSPGRGTVVGRTLLERQTVHVKDVLADLDYTDVQRQRLGNYRTILGVPLLRDQTPIGSIILLRSAVKPFSVAQINLVETFADQAVIAIENARLFDQLQHRTNDLSESLQQQTATSEVLQIISSSPGDLTPVFDKMLENATRVCGAEFGSMVLIEAGDVMRSVALYNAPPELAAARVNWTFKIHPQSSIGKAFRQKRVVQTEDLRQSATYLEGNVSTVELAELGGARTIVVVPMLRDDEVIGMITVYRQHVRLFGEKQIDLLRNFARQAVIAIENARLLRELRQRTDDLSEALVYQTGSSNILKVIASSPTDVGPALAAIVESACEICAAYDALVFLQEDDELVLAAHHGPIPIEFARWPINRQWISGRALVDKAPQHIHDINGPDGDDFPEGRELARHQRYRTALSVPLLREGEAIGVITIRRVDVSPFSDKQVALLQTFADQAVIAIGNVRLFEEVQARTRDLQESLRQQTATSEVLKVISSSPGELAPVFRSMLENAVEICDARFGNLFLVDGNTARWEAGVGTPSKLAAYFTQSKAFEPTPGSHLDRVIQTRQVSHTADDTTEAVVGAAARLGGARSTVCVPMVKDDVLVGAIFIYRTEVRPFTDKQVDLVKNFAAQAVIAIENTRLLRELRERTDALTRSLDNLRTAQDRLIQTEKLASLGQLTAGIAHEIKNPLNFVNNFSALSAELVDEVNEVLDGTTLDAKPREELKDLTLLLKSNLEKVVQHGKRADSIVKNMLQHSRESSGEHRPVDINAIVEESLNLAYHGARAEKTGFEITLKHDLDPDAGALELYPQEMTRALLNLISNGFYAATRRKAENGDGAFEPVLSAATKNLGETVEIRIRDNGTGIAPEVKEKMFNPFFTTKPTGEGTGLGLSMTHDIIVKQHGGRIDVETEPGAFTEFIITLPRSNGTAARPKPE